jgi:hypothetical protein
MADVFEGRDPREARDALDARFARFGLRPLSDADVWALGMATMVMPDGSPGPEGYLSQVSGTALFAERLTIWGRVVAIGISQAGYKARNGTRRRAYVEGYCESWGRYAVADGLTLALYGKAERNAADRVHELGCGRQAYERIRDFVGGALVSAIEEFRVALEWATGSRRDRVFDGRWEAATGLIWSDALANARIGHQSGQGKYPLFSPGCGRTPKADEAYNPGTDSPPETLYHGLRPCDWWDEAEARRMRNAPVTMIIPGHGP